LCRPGVMIDCSASQGRPGRVHLTSSVKHAKGKAITCTCGHPVAPVGHITCCARKRHHKRDWEACNLVWRACRQW